MIQKLSVYFLIFLASCSLPRGGPTSSSIISSFRKKIIKINEQQAININQKVIENHKKAVYETLISLGKTPLISEPYINKGNSLFINLMSYSPDSNINLNQDNLSANFTSKNLGVFTVNEHCNIHLPYLGDIAVCGLTEEQARNKIQFRYEQINIVREPYVLIHLSQNKQNDILVSGDISSPRIIPWQAGGIQLSTALTLAQNTNSNLIRNNEDKLDTNKTVVNIIRHEHTYMLPYDIALKANINLAQGDKIIIKSSPEVRATLIGGGILKSGIYNFSIQPSLIEVLAKAGGFDPNNADISNIFVFRKLGEKLNVYQFEFKKGSGLAAAAFFPIFNRDIIFAPESKIVPWLRIMSIAFQLALPAAILK